MANVVFASNNISHFPGTVAVASAFDAARVPYAIRAYYGQLHGGPAFTKVTGDVTWLHFRLDPNTSTYDASTILQMWDETNQIVFTIAKVDNSGSAKLTVYNGDGGINVNQNFGLTNTTLTYDLKITVSAFLVEVEIYMNGVTIASQSIGSNANGLLPPNRLVIGGGGGSSGCYFSEIIVADDDTRNARLDLLRPAAAGAYSEWGGSLAFLADDDATTGMITIDPNKRQSMSLTPYGGSSNISNVIAVSTTTRGQNSPTQLNHFVRLSGVDYDAAAHAVPFTFSTEITDWPINPATSLPWTAADVLASEIGFQSLA